MRRHRISSRASKRSFSRGADRIHRVNFLQGGSLAMRGGIRL